MSSPSTRPFILLLEDSDDDAFFFERTLRKCVGAIDILRFNNGADAVRFFEHAFSSPSNSQPRPDYVFIDLKLPVMSGFEVLQWLLAKNVLAQLKVSILSGSESVADVRRAVDLGVIDYLVKPIPMDVLQARISSSFSQISGGQKSRCS